MYSNQNSSIPFKSYFDSLVAAKVKISDKFKIRNFIINSIDFCKIIVSCSHTDSIVFMNVNFDDISHGLVINTIQPFSIKRLKFHNCENLGRDDILSIIEAISKVANLVGCLEMIELFYNDLESHSETIDKFIKTKFKTGVKVMYKEYHEHEDGRDEEDDEGDQAEVESQEDESDPDEQDEDESDADEEDEDDSQENEGGQEGRKDDDFSDFIVIE